MTDKSINILKEINLDDCIIDELRNRVEKVCELINEKYNMGYYMGFISCLFGVGIISSDDYDELASEVEQP